MTAEDRSGSPPGPDESRPNRPNRPDWYADGLPHAWLPYSQMKIAAPPLAAARTEGAHIHLADGRVLVDGIASWWTACHGYNHPHIRAAVTRQLETMPHVMFGGLVHEPALHLAKRLAGLLPGDLDHVFFSESGSVSVEIAMKMAIQYWINRGIQGRRRFVSLRFGYHGDTTGAMSVCDPDEGMHTLFRGALLDQHVVPLPQSREEVAEFGRFLRGVRDEVAAVMIEPLVQGAGGMKFHGPETLAAIRRACDEADILLIADEIFTGFGRTGTLFACTQAEVVPDIMTVSKALTGGTLPLAATVARRHVFEAFLSDDPGAALMHGPTYMANPLGCAAANASLDLFETEPRLQQVAAISAHLQDALAPCRALPGVIDVRVKGAIGVVQVAKLGDVDGLKRRFVEHGAFIRPFGDIVYLTPCFTIAPDDLTRLTDAMLDVLREWSRTA